MAASYLLRFQENVRPGDGRATKTKTAVETEQPDERQIGPLAGTKTTTEVKRETADADPQARSHFALPR